MKKLLLHIQFPDRAHVAEDLAISRIATFAYLILAHWNFLQFERYLTLPIGMNTPSGLSLNGIFEIAVNFPGWKLGYQIALLFGLFGFLTPFAIAFVSLIFSLGVALSFSYGFSSHDALPLSVMLWMLVLADTSRKYSIDSLLFKRTKSSSNSKDTRMLVSSAAIRCYLTLIAFASGYTKLKTSGLAWALSDNLQNILIRQNYYFEALIQNNLQRNLNLLVTSVPYLAMVMALFVLLIDLLAPLANFKRFFFFKFPIFFGLFQLGNYLIMYINFINWLPLYFFWVPWTKWIKVLCLKLGRRAWVTNE